MSFDTLPHDQLLKCLERRIADRKVLKLIHRWLQAVVVETDRQGRTKRIRPKQGTPQGGVVSPLLANVYLHWFEVAFQRPGGPAHWANARLVRYADDFVILARRQGKELIDWVERMLEGRFKLTLNRKKTKVVNLNQPGASLDFLGFTFRYDRDLKGRSHRYWNVFPSDKAVTHARDKVRVLTGRQRRLMPATEMIGELNCWMRGWAAYFRHGYPRKAFRRMNYFILGRLAGHLRRRSQRSFRTPEGRSLYAHLQALGLQQL